ncbi:MAG TPA: DEAD/DEAH box helicase [Saprospiraceae bacterium]|nr:DEAD/DEAH box helicase [Saprospiraceae bacterium]
MYSMVEKAAERYEVVYNLEEVYPSLFLPIAYIVTYDKEGYLAHIKQRAMSQTVGSFNLELTEVRKRLFEIIDLLEPKVLEKKFSPPRRKQRSLLVLLEDANIKKTIFAYVHRLLAELLTQVAQHHFPITWNVERKVLVKDFVMGIGESHLEARLAFERTESEVLYQLKLANGAGPWKIKDKEVTPITNHPAWLNVDHTLYHVPDINGNMVKPFRNRDQVRIPEDKVKTYFQKFIVKIASRVDIEAEGFDVVQFEELQACRLEIVPGLFEEKLLLSVTMQYPNAEFRWNDPKSQRTSLQFEEEIRILQVKREASVEKAFIEKLKDFGLEQGDGSYFRPKERTEDDYFLVEWLIKHKAALEKAGFTVAETHLEDQQLDLHPPTLDLETEQVNDWFDIHGVVSIGEYSFAFKLLAKYISQGNRLYPLPNGTYFLIPEEWMNKYKSLVQFARSDQENMRINKSQYTLLNEVGLADQPAVEIDPEALDFTPSQKLKADLRPYQLEGAKWLVQLYNNGLGGCLADDMGLGKTLQTIAVLLHAKEQLSEEGQVNKGKGGPPQLNLFAQPDDHDFLNPLHALVVLPASLVFNWESELLKFAPHLSVYKHTGPKRHKKIQLLQRFDVILTTYQTALRDADLLREMEFEYIVLDESQQIKNRESKVFKALSDFEARHRVSLSGTPIENSLSDLWSQMQFINPDLLGSYGFFKREFISPIEKHQDEDKKTRLRNMVQPYLLRRTKREVAKDLPPLTTKIFYSEMSGEQKKLYEREKSAARNYLLENFDTSSPKYRILVLQSLTKLRQIVNHPKLVYKDYDKNSSKFTDILEHWDVIRRSGHKALFFSSFVQYLKLFRTQFEKEDQQFSWLTGDLLAKERHKQIQRFEEDERVRSFLISMKSGGTGLNLTAAEYVFILDPWWNPTTEQQAIARAHRIGQEKNVIAVKFITRDSIEEKILRLQQRKSRLAHDIIDHVNSGGFSQGDIEFLLS